MNVPGDNFYGPVWSPNGEYVAFNYMGKEDWEIGIIKSDNSGFRTIKGKPTRGLHGPTWTADSKYIVAHDLQELFQFDLNGEIIKSFPITDTFGDELSFSSNSRFWLTKDNVGIFFNAGVAESMKGVDGPVEAILYFDIKTKTTERISPVGLYADNLIRLTDEVYLFNGSKEGQETSDIYMYHVPGKKMDLLIKDGAEPSGKSLE